MPTKGMRKPMQEEIRELEMKLTEGLPYLGEAELSELKHALGVAVFSHANAVGVDQARLRAQHAVNVVLLLGEVGQVDMDVLLAAILEGTLSAEESPLGLGRPPLTYQALEKRFGGRVALLVESQARVSRLEELAQTYMEQVAGVQRGEGEHYERLVSLMLSEAENFRVLVLAVSSHLVKLRFPELYSVAEQAAHARKALDVYAPLSQRLGLHSVQNELENLAFQRRYPRQWAAVVKQMSRNTDTYQRVLELTTDKLTRELEQDDHFMSQIESVVLSGRRKAPYSLWKKMLRRGCDATDVYDAVALRVVLEARRNAGESESSFRKREEKLVYEVMEKIKGLYPTMGFRVKDYVSSPKPNGYRSLHNTALMYETVEAENGPIILLHPFEVQVRTLEMHQQAEYGMAAHWSYKAADKKPLQLAATPSTIKDNTDLVQWLHDELQRSKVFVFGPDGLIWALDKSAATAADVVHKCSMSAFYNSPLVRRVQKALVNGAAVPHDYRLKNGDSISVLG
ncbi:unnamed protein product [Chrysoparadoxa australica]